MCTLRVLGAWGGKGAMGWDGVRMGCLNWDDWDELFASSTQEKLTSEILTLDFK